MKKIEFELKNLRPTPTKVVQVSPQVIKNYVRKDSDYMSQRERVLSEIEEIRISTYGVQAIHTNERKLNK